MLLAIVSDYQCVSSGCLEGTCLFLKHFPDGQGGFPRCATTISMRILQLMPLLIVGISPYCAGVG